MHVIFSVIKIQHYFVILSIDKSLLSLKTK